MRPGGYWKWADTPSTTVAGDPGITAREHHYEGEQNSTSFKLTAEEATILQTFPPFEAQRPSKNYDHQVLDGFAGSGVGVALKHLGAEEFGIEKMPDAIETRKLNGMTTIYEDIWDIHLARQYANVRTHWMSPPCQTFSAAGGGAGRRALDQVLSVIRRQWNSIDELRAEALELGDERIGLVLTPLHYALTFLPAYIAWEQVPPVLPIWEAMATVLRAAGYSVWTGILNAEQYGVPQTRRRAILMARRDGVPAKPPTPTHSRYYPRDPQRLDTGVEKWVSMAEALGWGLTGKPSYTVTGGGSATGGAEPFGNSARQGMAEAAESGSWALRSNYGTSGDSAVRGERLASEPAPTLTSKAGRNKWFREEVGKNMSPDEAAALQTYPVGFVQNNKLPHQSVRPLGAPAPTITAGHDRGNRGFLAEDGTLTVASPAEVASLQSYPPFRFAGTKTSQFLQIGNAVPPLLAQAIFEELWSR